MQLEIDINLLTENEISADDYLALYAIYRKGFKTLSNLKLNPNWDDLQEKGFVKIGPEGYDTYIVRQKFIDLFASDFDQMFAQLLATYPMKVRTSNGIRVLHASDPDAKTNFKAKERYRKIVLDRRHVHYRIMKLLHVQLKVDKQRLEYLQNLEVWINNHTWEKYTNIDDDAGEQERITRRL